jgi:uncharacterized protein (TIGR00251 family)
MMVEVSVVPNSGRFAITIKEGRLKIRLASAPEGNKANIELMKELGKATGRAVRILSGLSSRRKRLEIDMTGEEWKAFLSSLPP